MTTSSTETHHQKLLRKAAEKLGVKEHVLFMKAAARAMPDVPEHIRSSRMKFHLENYRKDGIAPEYVVDFALMVVSDKSQD